MSADVTRKAWDVVREMMPHGGIVGVELDSPAYKDILREMVPNGSGMSRSQVDKSVRRALSIIGKFGFGSYDYER